MASSSSECTLTARWLFPVDGPPLEGGTLTIRGEQIVAVEPRGEMKADRDLGNVAILPGLVNAHTHLDLSGMRGQCPPPRDFTAWLRNVIRHRWQRTPQQVGQDICAGLAECLRYGTTLVGDISQQGISWPIIASAPLRAVIFLELLGLPADRAEKAMIQAQDWLEKQMPTENCRPGLSPHAPYSVRTSLLGKVAELVRQRKDQVPVAIHLAETRDELDLLQNRRGPFVDFLANLGVWDPQGLVDSPGEVIRQFSPAPGSLFIHGNYLETTALQPGASLVYCPRTHAAFGHEPHPFREFLTRGINVALGTDSLASNPDLDVLAEARFLFRQFPDISGATLLRMATLNGARALGWQDITGSLTPGKSADFVALPLSEIETEDPYHLIFASSRPVQEVWWRGRQQNPA